MSSTVRLIADRPFRGLWLKAIAMCPLDAELTTQQAADLLNVSPAFLIQLIDAGELPARMEGTQLRILRSDVLEYKRINDAARLRVLDELTREAQELGFY
jgi:excisionase family DNA binding protein